ncbi:MAG: hypothetical protein ABW185_14290 [Sedimenticola sp.]
MSKDYLRKLVLWLSICLLFPGTVLAEKWYFEPTASLRLGYDDNVRFSVSDKEGAFSSHLNAKARFGFRTEVSDVNLLAQLNGRRYNGLNELNTADQLLGLDVTHRSELDIFGLKGSYERDSTRTSELETTGYVRESKRRIKKNLNPSWNRVLTERTSLQVGYQYSDVAYSDVGTSGLVDYRYDTANAGLDYTLSESTNLQASLMASKYEASDAGTKFNSYGVRGGFSKEFSETLSGSFSLGITRTDSDFIGIGGNPDSASDNTPSLDLSLKKLYGNMILKGTLSMSQSASGYGRQTQQNALEVSLHKELSPRSDFSFQGRLQESGSSGGVNDSSDDRTYLSLEPKISWNATRWWTVSGSYRYRRQEQTSTNNGAAESNAVFLAARYVWPRE